MILEQSRSSQTKLKIEMINISKMFRPRGSSSATIEHVQV